MAVLETAMGYMTDLRFHLAVLIVVLSLYLLLRRGNRKWPPGPRPLPILGNLLDLRGKPHAFIKMANWTEKYGDIIYLKIAGMGHVIVLSSMETVREAFIHKGNDFAGRPRTYTGDIFSDNRKDILMADFGPLWKMQRKIAHNAIRKYASGNHLEELIHKSMDGLTKILQKQKEPFYPLECITLTIYNFLLMTCCGRHFEQDDPEFQRLFIAVEEGNELFGNGLPHDYFPALKYLPDKLFPSLTKFREVMDIMNQFLAGVMSEKRKKYDPDNVEDLVDLIIKYEHEAKEEDAGIVSQLTPEHFKQILSDLFFAGTDTSRYTLLWAVSLVASHPDVQKKMQEEIDAEIGPDRPVLLKDKDTLHYTNAVFHEVLRIRPLAAIGLPHTTMCDTSVGGYEIPKGTMVISNIWALHMDTNEWEEPEKFKPERWIDEDGKFYAPSRSFLPFSTGRRTCVGESLAKVELLVFLASIFQKFTFTPPPGETVSNEMSDITTLGPIPAPFKVVVKART